MCTVRRDVCRKLNNKSVISFTHILFIMPVLKLSRRTVYVWYQASAAVYVRCWLFWDVTQRRLVVTNVSGQPIRLVFMGQQSKKNGLSSYSYTRQQDLSLPNCNRTMKNVLFSVSRCWQERWDGIFSVVTRLWDDSRGTMVQLTGDAGVQSASKCDFAAPSASYSTGTRDSFPAVKRPGPGADH